MQALKLTMDASNWPSLPKKNPLLASRGPNPTPPPPPKKKRRQFGSVFLGVSCFLLPKKKKRNKTTWVGLFWGVFVLCVGAKTIKIKKTTWVGLFFLGGVPKKILKRKKTIWVGLFVGGYRFFLFLGGGVVIGELDTLSRAVPTIN